MFGTIMTNPSSVTIETEEKKLQFSTVGNAVAEDVKVTSEDGRFYLTADKTPVKEVRLTWEMPFPSGARFCGDHFERGYGDLEWRGMNHGRIFPWYLLCRKESTTAFYGVKTNPDSICHFVVTPRNITLVCNTRCNEEGVVLRGKKILLAEPVSGEYEGLSAYETGVEACKAMVTKPVFPDHTVYGFNNWYYAYGNSSAEEILENSAHLARVTEGIENRPYMVIDDCWQKLREEEYIGGPWQESNSRFPDMKKLAAEITAMGNIPGIWIRPLQNRASDIADEMYYDKSDDILDASRQDALDYIARDVRTIVGWGYKLIKHDFSTNDFSGSWGMHMSQGFPSKRGCRHYDNSKTTAMLIKDVYRTIHEAAEGKALILGCNTIGHLGVGYFEINRTGDDTSGHDFDRTRKMGVNTLAFRMCQDKIFYRVDADCVGICEDIDHEKNRKWLTLLAKSGTPLFVSVAPDTLDEEGNAYLSEMMKIASSEHENAVPLDMEDCVCPEHWKLFDGEESFEW